MQARSAELRSLFPLETSQHHEVRSADGPPAGSRSVRTNRFGSEPDARRTPPEARRRGTAATDHDHANAKRKRNAPKRTPHAKRRGGSGRCRPEGFTHAAKSRRSRDPFRTSANTRRKARSACRRLQLIGGRAAAFSPGGSLPRHKRVVGRGFLGRGYVALYAAAVPAGPGPLPVAASAGCLLAPFGRSPGVGPRLGRGSRPGLGCWLRLSLWAALRPADRPHVLLRPASTSHFSRAVRFANRTAVIVGRCSPPHAGCLLPPLSPPVGGAHPRFTLGTPTCCRTRLQPRLRPPRWGKECLPLAQKKNRRIGAFQPDPAAERRDLQLTLPAHPVGALIRRLF